MFENGVGSGERGWSGGECCVELVIDKKRRDQTPLIAQTQTFIQPVHDMPVVSYTPYLYSSVKKLGGIQMLKPLNEQTEHNAMYAFHTFPGRPLPIVDYTPRPKTMYRELTITTGVRARSFSLRQPTSASTSRVRSSAIKSISNLHV